MSLKQNDTPNVELLHYTPLRVADLAISQCWDKECQAEVNVDKITRVVKKFKHQSTIEHITYNFDISGISRGLLQELARHRIASYSVKSTRYTLKELKSEDRFMDYHNDLDYKRASKYLVWTGNTIVDSTTFFMLEDLRLIIKEGISNDIAKYALPEAYKTRLSWSINARSLMNFLSLRSDKSAHWEIRRLARAVFESLPEDHKFLYEDLMKDQTTEKESK